ncbi:hypothetical protein ColTof3_05379 [Colletotrichum tofieldiae]|nr:hypothetical protein ColTof3_05379 [Colletotrichum tofieldiae]
MHLQILTDVGTASGGANTGNTSIQTEKCRILLNEITWMRGLLHGFGSVPADLEAELAPLFLGPDSSISRCGTKTATVVLGQLDVAGLQVVAALLGNLIVLMQLRHCGAKDAQVLAGFLIRIGLARAEGEILDIVERLGKTQVQTHAGDMCRLDAAGLQVNCNLRRIVGVVVVSGGTPEVGDDSSAGRSVFLKEGDASSGPGGDVAAGSVECDGEVGAGNNGLGAGLFDLQLGREGAGGQLGSRSHAGELVLDPGDLVSGLSPVGGVLEAEGGSKMVDTDKVVLVLNHQLVAVDGQLERLIGLLELNQARCRVMGAVKKTVHDERAIMRTLAKVSSVGVVALTISILFPDTVVCPLPDVTTLEAGVLLKDLNVIVKTTGAVAHGVAVLAKNNGLVKAAVLLNTLCLDQLAQTVNRRVHVRVHVRSLSLYITLIVDWAARVELPGVLIHGLVVLTVEGLIAERPHNDTRVVLVTLNQLDHTVEVGLTPLGVLTGVLAGQGEGHGLTLFVIRRLVYVLRAGNGVVEAMALKIGLVHDPQTELVGELEETGVGRVVRASQGVDVVVLHDEEVALGVLERHSTAEVSVVLVPVHTSDADRHTVDGDEAILELDFTEANVLVDRMGTEGDVDAVQVGSLGGPLLRVCNGDAEVDLRVVGVNLCLFGSDDSAAVLAQLAKSELDSALLGSLDVDGREEGGIFVLLVQVGAKEPILDSGGLGDGEERDVAEDTCIQVVKKEAHQAAVAVMTHQKATIDPGPQCRLRQTTGRL